MVGRFALQSGRYKGFVSFLKLFGKHFLIYFKALGMIHKFKHFSRNIVDINAITRIRVSSHAKIDLKDYPNLKRWLDKITARPKTDKGLGVPVRTDPDE